MDTEPDTWIGRSAQQIADAVRAGRAKPRDVALEHLERIERLNARLCAFRVIRREAALAEADALAARPDLAALPLAGVPIAIKDNVAVAGEQTRNGSAASAESVNAADHPIVARLRAAGAIVVGLTNVPELCLMPMTDSVHGIARNPWDRQRTPGGSSGGSAAAVAAALVPIAHGNDGLGSIRIPASLCGLVGIKPGTGVVPAVLGGDGRPGWYGLSENGPLATTVRDAALALGVMADDPQLARLDEAQGIRVALSVQPTQAGLPIGGESRAAVLDTGSLLSELGRGHLVSRHAARYPVWLGPAVLRTWYSCAHLDARALDRAKLDRSTRGMAAAGRALEAARLGGGGSRARWRDGAADRFFGDHDVLVLPSVPVRAPLARRYGERPAARNTVTGVMVGHLCGPWNVAGWPAMNVPAGIGASGLPVGVQLVARPGGERVLLSLAAQIEAARPWPRHAPEYAVWRDPSG
ncbi:amidase [Actinocrinis puniceicyclus]|uniref:Amidase n=1 Tax=Actinocrinis puniceicyclus TaxID=977794 RepID=A0A8J8BE31_9ACTN|nr:amidase [Actinocrinis puniceicyclus]MBS2963384.1 amidase [Actinocrinis puniceicyclus]